MVDIHVGVISAGRPHHVKKIKELLGDLSHRWYVPAGDSSVYRAAGAEVIPIAGEVPLKSTQLNTCLEHAYRRKQICLTLDDDVKALKYYDHISNKSKKITAAMALKQIILLRDNSYPELFLGGGAPTDNGLYLRGKPLGQYDRYCSGQFAVHWPNDLRYTVGIEPSEDWDYWLQHQHVYGGAVRNNSIMACFNIRPTPGGFMTGDLEKRSKLYVASRQKLAEKWPDNVTWPHPKRGPEDIEIRINGHSAR